MYRLVIDTLEEDSKFLEDLLGRIECEYMIYNNHIYHIDHKNSDYLYDIYTKVKHLADDFKFKFSIMMMEL